MFSVWLHPNYLYDQYRAAFLLLIGMCMFLVWIPPKAEPERRTWKQFIWKIIAGSRSEKEKVEEGTVGNGAPVLLGTSKEPCRMCLGVLLLNDRP